MSDFKNGDIVSYPVNEGTKSERLTLGRLSGTGSNFWITGPEISSVVNDLSKCTLIAHKSKRADKIYKRFEEQMNKVSIEDNGFDVYESVASLAYERYTRKMFDLNE